MTEQWDIITLRGLSAMGSHGVHDFERAGSQVFTSDLKLFVDARKAAETDDVDHTVDYSQMAERAVEILSGEPVYLIETLASNLAEMALTFPLVQAVEATVHKPMAPVRHKFEDVSVSVVRTRAREQLPAIPEASPAKELRLTEDLAEMDRPAQLASQVIEPPAAPLQKPAFPSAKHAVRPVAPPPPPKPAPKRSTAPYAPPVKSRVQAPLPIARSFTDGSPVYKIVLALGSNRGDSLRTLSRCVDALSKTEGIELDAVSPVVRTLPVLQPGAFPQRDYMNAVVLARTVLPPPVLLQSLQRIEDRFGRTRSRRWAARTLDIDIIDIDGMTLDTRDLTLPHPRAHERAFVLDPWVRVAPDATLPGKGSIAQLLRDAPDVKGLLTVREKWLGEDGQVLEGTEITLNERPVKSASTLSAGLPTVEVRGEKLRLASVDDDPIFQRILSKETVTADPAPAPVLQPEPLPQPAPEPVFVEQFPYEPPAPVPPPVSVVPAVHPRDLPALPDWRGSATPQAPRIIDDESYAPPAPKPITVPVKRRARRVTMRPTPTGTIPVIDHRRVAAKVKSTS